MKILGTWEIVLIILICKMEQSTGKGKILHDLGTGGVISGNRLDPLQIWTAESNSLGHFLQWVNDMNGEWVS